MKADGKLYAMNANLGKGDLVMSRLLGVSAAAAAPVAESTRRAENVLTASLLFSGMRCILQYALLPFLLPLAGIAAEAALPILLLINVVAMASIYLSLRRFWSIGYKHRWSYLAVAGAALLLLVAFTIYDVMQLMA